jgi:hypothetical protein
VNKILIFSRNHWEKLFLAGLLVFSFYLMFHSFNFDFKTGNLLIGFKIWSDFAATLHLTRSFSLGHNWPPEYPLFPGQPIQYHFLFFYFVAMLEKIGIPLVYALNIPSALGFFTILLMIYLIAKKLFDKRVGFLAVLFFLFDGSLSFTRYFEKAPFSLQSLRNIWNVIDFPSNAPWDNSGILAFWTLNVFTNQRHFCVALGFLMAMIWYCIKHESKKPKLIYGVLFGLAVGLLPLFHKPILLMVAVVMIVYFLAFPNLRKFLFILGVASVFVMGGLDVLNLLDSPSAVADVSGWYPGYFIHDTLSIKEFFHFWWRNIGLHFYLIPIGFYFAPRKTKLFFLPAFIIFLIAFDFKFSQDVLANHKFFNFFLAMSEMLSAYSLFLFYDYLRKCGQPLKYISKPILVMAVFFLTFSGVINFLAMKNDYVATIGDVKTDKAAQWFVENTPKDSIVMNSSFLYHPASLAGRKIFLGWPYFVITAGYDADGRMRILRAVFSSESPDFFCPIFKKYNIGYLTVEDTSKDSNLPPINLKYFTEHFNPVFKKDNSAFAIYDVKDLCKGL